MNTQDTIFEIYDFYEPSLWESTWFKVAVAVAVVLLIALAVYLVFRLRRKPLTPGQWALGELAKIDIAQTNSKKEVKAAYFAMTTVIKQYLARRFAYKTLDKTDEELIAFLDGINAHGIIIEPLKKIRENTQWVKFAGYNIIKTQAENDLTTARELVSQCEELAKRLAAAKKNIKK